MANTTTKNILIAEYLVELKANVHRIETALALAVRDPNDEGAPHHRADAISFVEDIEANSKLTLESIEELS